MYKRLISKKRDGPIGRNKNLESFLSKEGIKRENLVRANLVHGNKITLVGKRESGVVIQGVDGLMTTDDVFLGVTVADCLPIYLFSNNFHGILHAGWRSLWSGIIKNAVKKIKRVGEDPKNVEVFIGPSIRSCHFEIKEDLVEKFSDYQNYFEKRNEKVFLSLQKVAENKFNSFGIKSVEISPECTYCNKSYFSYRRDRTSNNMLAVIGPNN